MRTLIILLSTVLPLWALADEPPEWRDFVVQSENENWTAVVERQGNSGKTWQDDWRLSVYKGAHEARPAPGVEPVWSAPYSASGYSTGYLSDHGEAFSYVEHWYYPNRPVVQIYRSKCIIEKKGVFFDVGDDLQDTASHELWLKRKPNIRYTSTSESELYLQIETIKGNRKISAVCDDASTPH